MMKFQMTSHNNAIIAASCRTAPKQQIRHSAVLHCPRFQRNAGIVRVEASASISSAPSRTRVSDAAPIATPSPRLLDASNAGSSSDSAVTSATVGNASTSQRSASNIVPFRRRGTTTPAPQQLPPNDEPSVWNITWDNWKQLTVEHLDDVHNLIQAELAVDRERLVTSVDNNMFNKDALRSRLAAGSLHGAFVDNGSKLCAIMTINFRPAADTTIQDQFSVSDHDVLHTGWISRSGVTQDAVQMEDSARLSQAVMQMSRQMPTLYLGTIINMKGSQNALTSVTTYIGNTFADVDQMCWTFGSKLGNDRSRALFLRKIVRMMLMHRPEEQRVRIYGFGHTAPDAKKSPAIGFTMYKESTLRARAPWLLEAAAAAEAASLRQQSGSTPGVLTPALVAA